MFEIIILSVILFLVTACAFPLGGGRVFVGMSRQSAEEVLVTAKPAMHTETYTFLNYLKSEIEAELFPRPTDSVLRRHYDALVAVELENRLALMAE